MLLLMKRLIEHNEFVRLILMHLIMIQLPIFQTFKSTSLQFTKFTMFKNSSSFKNTYHRNMRIESIKFNNMHFMEENIGKSLSILIISFLILFSSIKTFAQNPAYTLDVNDRSLIFNTLEFDIDLAWTNSDSVPKFEYAGGQYFFEFNPLIANGGTLSYFYVVNPDTISDLPVSLRPRNPVTTGSQLRLAANNFPGAGNGFQMPAGTSVRIVRMKLTTSAEIFANELLNLAWRNGPDNPYTKITAYVGTINTDISNPSSHTISIPNDPLEWRGFVPNFFSNVRTIVEGQHVNFFDSTYGTTLPVSWKWSFPGGNPDTSSLEHPAGILYNTPGSYDVSLIVSDSLTSDTLTKAGYITVIPTCNVSWLQSVTVTDAGNEIDSVKFGMSVSGTNGIDLCLGEFIIPPPPPAGLFDARFVLPASVSSKTDIRNAVSSGAIWYLSFQPSEAGYPVTFSWDTSFFPTSGSFSLKDQATQTLVNVDMRNQSSYTLTNPNIVSLMIEYVNETKSIQVDSGWNIVSVPLRTPDMNYLALFPGAASQAFTYDNGYVNVNTLSNGEGYWMKFSDTASYSFTGYPYSPEHISVRSEWNLIGPFDADVPVSSLLSNPPGIINSNFFGYLDGYVITDTLKAGKGYWVNCLTNGYLYEVTLDNTVKQSVTSYSSELVELRFENSSGNVASLFLGDASQLTGNYILPPVPPSGIYDVRFESDKFAELLGKIQRLKINSAPGITRITLHNSYGLKFNIKDAINGSILNTELAEGAGIEVPSNLENLILEPASSIPLTYELYQNYPNPFNPTTTIKFQTAGDGQVKLVVFDVLGREVRTLVNGFRPAGVYEAKFDASDFSSGAYFYKIQAGKFEQLKKMMIIK